MTAASSSFNTGRLHSDHSTIRAPAAASRPASASNVSSRARSRALNWTSEPAPGACCSSLPR